jgi:antitoxin component HigA of HigAB toxin-antitoxin module
MKITTDKGYRLAIADLLTILGEDIDDSSEEAKELAKAIEAYEKEHFPLDD